MSQKSERIIEEISDLLAVYLKAGKVGLNSFIKKAHLNISQLEQLLNIHFLLKKDVQKFVNDLPSLIRRFKTSTMVVHETYIGEVRGQINWPNTLKERYRMNPEDKTIFSCNERNRNYDIPENLVLKELLYTIYNVLFVKIDSERLERYEYFKEWKTLKPLLEELLRKNVYLSRIKTDTRVTDRMIQKTLRHRNPLYQEAARLLRDYRQLMKEKLNEKLIRDLLTETFIFPEKEEVLFELYWVMQLIKQNTTNAELQLIDGKNNLVASWENDDFIYDIYHDSQGSRELAFNISTEEVSAYSHPYIDRKLASINRAENAAKQYFGSAFDSSTFWSGRPDILIEVYRKDIGKLARVIIGEVKDTERKEYAITGLRELVDYMTFVKGRNGSYLNANPDMEVEGFLFVGEMGLQSADINQIKVFSLKGYNQEELLLNDVEENSSL